MLDLSGGFFDQFPGGGVQVPPVQPPAEVHVARLEAGSLAGKTAGDLENTSRLAVDHEDCWFPFRPHRPRLAERGQHVAVRHRHGEPVHHGVGDQDGGSRDHGQRQTQIQAGRDVPGARRTAELDPGRTGLLGHLLDVRPVRVDLHPRHAAARRAHQPDGQFLRDALRRPDVVGWPVEQHRQRRTVRVPAQPGPQRPVPGVVGEHDIESEQASDGRYPRIDPRPGVGAGLPGPGSACAMRTVITSGPGRDKCCSHSLVSVGHQAVTRQPQIATECGFAGR